VDGDGAFSSIAVSLGGPVAQTFDLVQTPKVSGSPAFCCVCQMGEVLQWHPRFHM